MDFPIQKLIKESLGVLSSDVWGPLTGRTSSMPPTTQTSEVLRQRETKTCSARPDIGPALAGPQLFTQRIDTVTLGDRVPLIVGENCHLIINLIRYSTLCRRCLQYDSIQQYHWHH